MIQPPDNDFSRYELMVLHRLDKLEEDTKSAHKAFEDLRVEIVQVRSDVEHAADERDRKAKAYAGRVALAVSTFVGIFGAVAPHFF